MAQPLSLEALREELTIQQVILKSLECESFDGVDQERAETSKHIERLEALLVRHSTQAQPPEPSESSENAGHMDAAHAQNHQSLPASSTAQRLPISPTTNPRQSPAAWTTPRKHKMDNASWSNPASGSQPTPKRNFDSTGLSTSDGQSKSRRTTLTPTLDRRFSQDSHSNSHGVEIIDLTGDDVDFDSTCIAEQIKHEKRREQEVTDRDLALQLSRQEPPRSVPSHSPTTTPDAFTKLMATQKSNSRQTQPVEECDWLAKPEVQGESSSLNSSSMSLPGAYDARFDEPFGPGQHAPTPQTAYGNPHFNPVLPVPQSVFQNFLPPGGNPSTDARHLSLGPGGMPPSLNHPFVLPSQSGHPAMAGFNPALGMPGLSGTPSLPSSGGLDMKAMVGKTGLFDYSSRLDHEGNPLSARLSNFLESAFHDPRVTEKDLDDLLKNIRPDMDIPERNRDGTPAGLKSALYPHQELALSWMKSMEDGTNKGGILADDMGLGKTISTLALMLARPAKSRPKTNLIIGPLSLVRQWEEEIARKTKLSHRMSVFVYHNKKATTEDLLQYDVVLTTYGTIAQECKRLEKFMEENADRNVDFNDRVSGFRFPLLHPIKAAFHRVILDEAQCIKNKNTKTAKACCKLKSTYRWCLTGTPMMNGVLELYSLVHFLRIKPYSNWEQFRQAFGVLFGLKGDPTSVAMNRLRALLKATMLRRKKDSQLDGKPILKLPPKTELTVYAKLSPDEREFYKQLEEKSQVQFSKYLREGSIGKNYSNILVLLLRLRQACCHPHLNLDVDDACAISSEDMIQLVQSLDASTVERIKAKETFECPICFDTIQAPSFLIPCGHDSCKDCLVGLVESAPTMNLQSGDESDRAKCPVCRGMFDPKKCFTYDAFRSVYMPETIIKKSESDAEDSSSDDESESEYGEDDEVDQKGNLKGFIVEDDNFDDMDNLKLGSTTEAREAVEALKKKKKKKAKGKKKSSDVKPSMLKSLRAEAVKNRDAYKRYMRYLRKTWMPAAKVSECMGLLKAIQEMGEKTIVFSQWTLLLDLLQVAMWHENFKNKPERYDGSMSGEQRAAAARKFRDRSDVTVMLVSLRAGNAGLNLTAANNVIIMDPFWNPYIEMQAVDRAYRIGQQQEVKVFRILTEATVEDRIIALQERKKEIVEAALDETESMKIGRLGVSELKFLFDARD